VQWADGWRIQPDVVVSMAQPFRVPAKGAGEIRKFIIDSPFKEDTWVSAIEIRPGDASVVHHVILQVPELNQVDPAGFSGNALNLTGGVASVTVCADCGVDPGVVKRPVARVEPGVVTERPVPVTRVPAAQNPQVAANLQAAAANLVSAANGLRVNAQGGTYSDIIVRLQERETGRGHFTTMEAVYAPGTQPLDFRYSGSAKLIPGGKPLVIEVHYTPNGKITSDQTKIAFTLAKAPAQRRFVMMAPEHLVDSRKPIPAGDANYETKGELTFTQDAELVWFMPHMHLRGKDMTFKLVYPDGREETVLSTKFNFNWQLGYEVEKPIKVPKNTKMIVTAHHDNSANNPMNPAPESVAQWGEMTSQEMMLPWFGVIVDRSATPDKIAMYTPPDLDSLPGGFRGVVRRPAPVQPARPVVPIPPALRQ
jgi:hypothetical protein